MAAVKSLCTHGIVLQNGTNVFDGSQVQAVKIYQSLGNTQSNFSHKGKIMSAPGNDNIRILKLEILPQIGDVLSIYSGVDFLLDFYNSMEGKNIDVTFEVTNQDEVLVFHNGAIISQQNDSSVGIYSVKCRLPQQFLNSGIFSKITLDRTYLPKYTRIHIYLALTWQEYLMVMDMFR